MRFASLGSGSRGNSTLVQFGDTLLMIDCGFSGKEAARRMARLGVVPEQLDAILVTHEHGDHVRGAAILSRRHRVPVYASAGTADAARLRGNCELQEFESDSEFTLGELRVQAVSVPHDAREPTQFLFRSGAHTLGVLTDLGSYDSTHINAYRHCDALLLECNHDPEMLAWGPYPPSLKRRVGGLRGHLSNHQAADFLDQIAQDSLQHLVISHISEQNNCPIKVKDSLSQVLVNMECAVFATQDDGFEWLEIV